MSSSGRSSACDTPRSRPRASATGSTSFSKTSPIPILVTDEQSNIILMNDQAEQLFQLDEHDAPRSASDAAVRGNDTKFTTFISDFALSPARRAARADVARCTRDRRASSRSRSSPARSSNERGEPIAIVSVLHDLTKQVENERLYEELKRFNSELEERIARRPRDLAEQNPRLQWQSQELEKANRLKSRVPREHVARAAHADQRAHRLHGADARPHLRRPHRRSRRKGCTRIQGAAAAPARAHQRHPRPREDRGRQDAAAPRGRVARDDHGARCAQQIEPMVRKKALEFNVRAAVPRRCR